MTESMLQKVTENADRVFFPLLGKNNIFTNGLKINREFLSIGNFVIYWYGFLIALGALLAILYSFSKFKKFGINPDKAVDAVMGGFIGAVIGARLYYVAFSWSDYVANGKIQWMDIINIRDGGLAIYGGIIGALLVGGIILRLHKIRIFAMFDIAAMGLLIGQAIGRWGNFFNQEAYGSITKMPWGMTSAKIVREITALGGTFTRTDIVVHPCFLYESLWCILGFILLSIYMKHRRFDGEIFFMYTGWYGLGRGIIEGLRTDSLYIGNTTLRVSQLLAILCVIASVAIIAIYRVKIKDNGGYTFFYETDISKQQLEEYNNPKPKEKKQKMTAEDKKDMSKAIENAFDEKPETADTDNSEEKPQVTEDSEDNDNGSID